MAHYRWGQDRVRDRLRQLLIERHAGLNSIGIIDETSDVKKGDKTPGVQRQWCGTVGKTENCIVTVHLGYATGDFHRLVDGELFLPESWSEDRDRCDEAGIPAEMTYRPKWKITLELHQRATAGGSLVRSWWLNGRASARLIEHTARVIQRTQQRNATARKSHLKRKRRKLRGLGIKLKDLIHCKWP